jgi:uncharacterized protein YbjQ (UPF0145 family)
MKNNKAEAPVKESKKAAKKALEKSLTDKFFEAVKSLGHDAEQIGGDLVLVSKFVAKKIAKKVASKGKDVEKKAAKAIDAAVPVTAKVAKEAKKTMSNGIKEVVTDVKEAKTKNTKPVVAKPTVPASTTAVKPATKIEKAVPQKTTAKKIKPAPQD